MIGKLSELVTGGEVMAWLVIAILVVYFIYKEWPDFKNRITKGALEDQKEEQHDRTVEERLDSIEKDIREINEKIGRDYTRINEYDKKLRKTQEIQADEMEELEIIMRALLGVLRGLQEQGANGPTKQAEGEILEYLGKKAHRSDDD